jgi:hypothetical protein
MLRDMKKDAAAAARYAPKRVRVVVVAEAPPCERARHFYFEDAGAPDTLWLETMKAAFGTALPKDAKQARAEKAAWLRRFADAGGVMVDLVQQGLPQDMSERERDTRIRAAAADGAARIAAMKPELVVLVKKSVWEGFAEAARAADLPVRQSGAVAFPGSGNQGKFHAAMRELGFAEYFA